MPGTCVTVSIEGRRPLVSEVQALTLRTGAGSPRRSVSGLDASRVAMLLAVAHRHLGVALSDSEVYASSIGGIATTEPAADLAILLAVASAVRDVPLPQTLCALGEVSLSGDVRRVPALERRLAEAARLGFTVALVPGGHAGDVVAGESRASGRSRSPPSARPSRSPASCPVEPAARAPAGRCCDRSPTARRGTVALGHPT